MVRRFYLWLGERRRGWRALWVALQIVAAIWMAQHGIHFYYQGF